MPGAREDQPLTDIPGIIAGESSQSSFTETLGEISALGEEEDRLSRLPHLNPEQQRRLEVIPGLIDQLQQQADALQAEGKGI